MSEAHSDGPGEDRGEDRGDGEAGEAVRGFVLITGAKVWFVVTGAAVQLGLPVVFESARLFGRFKLVTESISLVNMVVITATMQAVAKLTSESPGQAREVMRRAVRLHLLVGLPLALGYALGAPGLAARLLHDASLSGLMQLSALIIVAYSFYAIFVGVLNGTRQFGRQAALDITFQTAKSGLMLGLVAAGFGVWGAVGGFVIAALGVMLISGADVWRRTPAPSGPALTGAQHRRLWQTLGAVTLHTLALGALMRADLFALKGVVAAPPAALPHLAQPLHAVSEQLAGAYGAALNLARLPYQGVIALTFVIFPMLSAATFAEDDRAAQTYITGTLRAALLLIASVAIPLAACGGELLGALYGASYQAAGGALGILSVGIVAFSMLAVVCTIFIGSGRPWAAVGWMGAGAAASVAACTAGVTRAQAVVLGALPASPALPTTAGGDAHALIAHATAAATRDAQLTARLLAHAPQWMEAAAWGAALACLAGCVGALAHVRATSGARLPWASAARLVVAAAVVGLAARSGVWPEGLWRDYGKFFYLVAVAVKMGIMGALTLLTLAALGELSASERSRLLTRLARLRGRREAP